MDALLTDYYAKLLHQDGGAPLDASGWRVVASLPHSWASVGSDGLFGDGPPVDDPLIVDVAIWDDDDGELLGTNGATFRTSMRDMVADCIDMTREGARSDGAPDPEMCRRIATSLRELADWAELQAAGLV